MCLPNAVAAFIALLGLVRAQPTGYIAYTPGTLPIVLSAPHGGAQQPETIPNRTAGCWVDGACQYSPACTPKDTSRCKVSVGTDLNTIAMTRALSNALFSVTGARPHVILCNLHRVKLDANRAIGEAAQGSTIAEAAWHEWHSYIDQATNATQQKCGRGLYMDVHGNNHAENWIEFGYLLTGTQLDLPDKELDPLAPQSSIATLAAKSAPNGVSFSQLLRGPSAMGSLISSSRYGGYKSVPSAQWPGPNGGNYFSGNYNLAVHGSRYGGSVDGIQMELNRDPRSTAAKLQQYAEQFALLLQDFFQTHYQIDLARDPCTRSSAASSNTSTNTGPELRLRGGK